MPNNVYKREDGHKTERALIRKCAELEEELTITDKLLAERQKVLDAIPECQSHGKGCIPNALEWIAKQKDLDTSIKEMTHEEMKNKYEH